MVQRLRLWVGLGAVINNSTAISISKFGITDESVGRFAGDQNRTPTVLT